MAGHSFQVNPVRAASVGHDAGTQFAKSYAGAVPTRPETYRMVAKLAILAAAVLVVTPAAVTVALPDRSETAALRSVSIKGPILSLTQSHDRIQVRLKPAATESERNARQHVIVRDADGDQLAIPLKPGQTWASAELPADLASADALEISLD